MCVGCETNKHYRQFYKLNYLRFLTKQKTKIFIKHDYRVSINLKHS